MSFAGRECVRPVASACDRGRISRRQVLGGSKRAATTIIRNSGELFVARPRHDLPKVKVWSRDGMLIIGDAAHACGIAVVGSWGVDGDRRCGGAGAGAAKLPDARSGSRHLRGGAAAASVAHSGARQAQRQRLGSRPIRASPRRHLPAPHVRALPARDSFLALRVSPPLRARAAARIDLAKMALSGGSWGLFCKVDSASDGGGGARRRGTEGGRAGARREGGCAGGAETARAGARRRARGGTEGREGAEGGRGCGRRGGRAGGRGCG